MEKRCWPSPAGYTGVMPDSIFTKIIRGEVPCHKVYEDDQTLAFLDIHPKTPGHTLIVPKKQVEFVWDLDDVTYQALMATAKKVAARLKALSDKPYIGEFVYGTDVPHAHVHVFPFANAQEYFFRPDMSAEPDHTALAAMAEKLVF